MRDQNCNNMTGAMKTLPGQGSVSSALSELASAVDGLCSAVEALGAKLAPACLPPPPPSSDGVGAAPYHVPLADNIAGQRGRILAVESVVRDLTARLEL
jgi:hypothetical protein